MNTEQTPHPIGTPWKARIAILFLAADSLYVGFNWAVGVHPLPSNYSFAQRAVTYFFVFSFQFLFFVAIGLLLSLGYNLIVGERGPAYRKRTWMSVLTIATLIAAFMAYTSWWTASRPS